MMKTLRILFVFAIFLNLFLLTGCNQRNGIKTDIVTGKITLDGKPLANANVNFTPNGGGNAAYGVTDENGVYKLQTSQGKADAGTTPGEYLVTIHKPVFEPTGKKITDSETKEVTDELKSRELVPDIYKNPKKSKLSAVIVAGKKNTFDFDLESK
ncbi:MAG: carboxypeptidase-like regulatory domain-containing protein [Planctomycetaceae bacterium]|nr:carboxypeptidase-like regulatory domain-containing protein [Planctomycetaceae bacterium]